MHTAQQTANHFQSLPDPIALVMNFDTTWLDQKFSSKHAGGYQASAAIAPKPVQAFVTPIEITFGQIDILWKLNRRTLERMATNPCTPVVVLDRLANHPMADIRAAVSDNENAPIYLLWDLARDEDAEVRYQLAENHKLAPTLLAALAGDENPYVACRAQATLDRLNGVG